MIRILEQRRGPCESVRLMWNWLLAVATEL